MTTVSFKGELSLFFKNVKYRINIQRILVTKPEFGCEPGNIWKPVK